MQNQSSADVNTAQAVRLFNSHWEYHPNGSDGGLDACFCLKDKTRQDGQIDITDPDIAAHVLRAVNCHAELVAALRAVLLLADSEGDLPDNGEYSGSIIADQIRAALEKAEVQS